MGGIDYLRLDKTKDKSYAFDHAFDERASQDKLFHCTTSVLIADVMRGANGTCFAYGATGSGKTHTMMGTVQLPGVIPLTVDSLFEKIMEASEDLHVSVSMQYIEIYNEAIKDLLEPANNQNLDVRESPKDGTYVSGAGDLPTRYTLARPCLLTRARPGVAATQSVSSRKELEALIYKGNLFRATESTNVNQVSQPLKCRHTHQCRHKDDHNRPTTT